MAERTHIPSSPACGEWETLVGGCAGRAIEPEDEAKFTAHKAVCPACAALYEEARKGREWLEFLSPAPEAPAELLEKILAKTGPGHKAATGWAAGDCVACGRGIRRGSSICSAGLAAAGLFRAVPLELRSRGC